MDGGSFTWTKGAGMNIVYKNATTLQFVDNGGASKPVIGFCLAAMTSSTASSNAYKGNYENYDIVTTLTAVQ